MRLNKKKIFFILYILYLINSILAESQYSMIQPYSSILVILRYAVLIAFVALVLSRTIKMDRKSLMFGGLVLFSTIATVIFYDGGISLLYIVFLLLSARNTSLTEIFRITIITIVGTYLFVIASSQIGIIPDTVGMRWIGDYAGSFFAGAYLRHAMGFLVSNQVPVTFLMVYILIIGWRKEDIPFYFNAVVVALNIYLFYKFGARIVFVFTFVTILLYYAVKLRKVIEKHRAIKKKRKSVLSYSFIICAALSFIISVVYSYHPESMSKLDLIFNHRISMASQALNYYGIHILGSGKDAATYNGALNTITVDNGYVSMFIQNGLIVGIIVIAAWTFITQRATYYKNHYLLWVLVIISILNLINSDLISYRVVAWYCILVNQRDPLMMSDELVVEQNGMNNKKKRLVIKKSKFRLIT